MNSYIYTRVPLPSPSPSGMLPSWPVSSCGESAVGCGWAHWPPPSSSGSGRVDLAAGETDLRENLWGFRKQHCQAWGSSPKAARTSCPAWVRIANRPHSAKSREGFTVFQKYSWCRSQAPLTTPSAAAFLAICTLWVGEGEGKGGQGKGF